jgi:small subunit ribosomal protein S4
MPPWLTVDPDKRQITILDLPERHHIDVPVQETLIVELYSK